MRLLKENSFGSVENNRSNFHGSIVCWFQIGADANRIRHNGWAGNSIPRVAEISRAILASKETFFRFGILIIRG
jgi:hypothetical protein